MIPVADPELTVAVKVTLLWYLLGLLLETILVLVGIITYWVNCAELVSWKLSPKYQA